MGVLTWGVSKGLADRLWVVPMAPMLLSWCCAAKEVLVTGLTLFTGAAGFGDDSDPVGITDGFQVEPPLKDHRFCYILSGRRRGNVSTISWASPHTSKYCITVLVFQLEILRQAVL